MKQLVINLSNYKKPNSTLIFVMFSFLFKKKNNNDNNDTDNVSFSCDRFEIKAIIKENVKEVKEEIIKIKQAQQKIIKVKKDKDYLKDLLDI